MNLRGHGFRLIHLSDSCTTELTLQTKHMYRMKTKKQRNKRLAS
jgi:hypothetical protein